MFLNSSKPIRLICLSSTRWKFLWQRPQQIMSRLADRYSVLFVDPPFPVAKESAVQVLFDPVFAEKKLQMITDSLSILEPVQISRSSNTETNFQKLRLQNHHLVKAQIMQVLNSETSEKRLLWVYNPYAVDLVGHLGEDAVIYDCVDSFRSFSWSHPDIGKKEDELVRKADVVITTANKLFQERKKQNPATYLVPNAADYNHFSQKVQPDSYPEDIYSIPNPRLGFSGALYEWVDFDLIEFLADRHLDWNIVLIGPKQHGIQIPERENIHWLGIKDYNILPLYLQAFDVTIIPFKKNETTMNTNPIKLWEYLSAGKSVVSTLLPEIPAITNVIWLSSDAREFELNCTLALQKLSDLSVTCDISHEAQAIARNNSWEKRCDHIYWILNRHFGVHLYG